MKEQLINFETAELSKEKGFNLSTLYWYDLDSKNTLSAFSTEYRYQQKNLGKEVLAPTQSLLQKWLRDRKIPIIISINFGAIDDSESAYTWHIKEFVPNGIEGTRKKDEYDFWKDYDSFTYSGGDWYKTYEEALESALQTALKLIK